MILRALVNLEAEGGDTFFGEPEIDMGDLLRTAGGQGVVTLFELGDQAARPTLFSTFLMWVLADLFQYLPEAGDLDKPKLVFIFDEAHLLFDVPFDEPRTPALRHSAAFAGFCAEVSAAMHGAITATAVST